MNNSNAYLRDDAGVLIADLSGTVVDYDFSNDPGYKGSADVITNIADAGFGGRNNINLWTETMDPGSDPAIAAQGDNGTPGTGTIDISTLSAGTVWIICGIWSGDILIDATLTDTDGILSDVVMTQFSEPYGGAQGRHYAFEMNFADAGEYEQITWTTSNSNYFTGVVVTEAIPEPPAFVLGAFGSLLLLRRRS